MRNFVDEAGKYDPLVKLVLLVSREMEIEEDPEFIIPGDKELYDMAVGVLKSPDWSSKPGRI